MHFIQRKQFSKTNVTLHAVELISDLKIFPECFGGPLKTVWRDTCGPRACSWTTLIYLMQHRNKDLYSFIACESQSFKRVFYLKQILVITEGALGAEGQGQLPPLPHPLNPALVPTSWHFHHVIIVLKETLGTVQIADMKGQVNGRL